MPETLEIDDVSLGENWIEQEFTELAAQRQAEMPPSSSLAKRNWSVIDKDGSEEDTEIQLYKLAEKSSEKVASAAVENLLPKMQKCC